MLLLTLVFILWSLYGVKELNGSSVLVSHANEWTDELVSANTTIIYRPKRFVDRSLPNDGQISLVLIFDDTGSMFDDLVELRKGAKSIVTEFEGRVNNPIFDYILVRFNDPGVGEAFKTIESKQLFWALDQIKVTGGGDCPEMAYKGILNGIHVALPKSHIFVFTDAHAKDTHLMDTILKIAKDKAISISFLVSGKGCTTDNFISFNTIAKRTGGQVYNIGKSNVEDVVQSIAEVLDTGLMPLESTYSEKPGKHDFGIDVDGSMKKLVASVTGANPSIKFTDPNDKISTKVKHVLKLPTAIIDKVTDPEPGKWHIKTNSSSPHYIKISGISDIQVRAGFSYILPEEYSDTAPVPIKDISNYLSVFVWKNKRNHTFTEAEVVILTSKGEISKANHTLSILDPDNCDSDLCIYVTNAFIPPLDTFKIFVKGIDVEGNPVKYLVLTNVETVPGDDIKPKVTISSREVKVIEGGEVHIVCKVTSPKRSVLAWYFEDKVVEDGPFRRVNHKNKEVFLDFYKIKLDESGTYHCHAKNPYGQQSEKVKIIVEEIPWKIEMNEKTMETIENEKNYEIKCIITPEGRPVAVKWTFNGEPAIESDHLKISGNTLLLKTVNRRHEGNYTCEGSFKDNSRSSSGYFTVNFPPQINGPTYEEHMVEFDDKINLECSADGNPMPNISWIRVDGAPSNATIEKFSPADYGLHICEVSNGIGSVQKRVNLTTKYGLSPKIFIKTKQLYVDEDQMVSLSCQVIAPNPVDVKWFFRNDETIRDSRYHKIKSDKDNTLLILRKAQLEDAGTYSCHAENSFGSDKESVNLNVRPIPLRVEITKRPVRVIENDENVTLECSVLPPKRRINIKWMLNERILHNSEEFLISENTLIIKKVNRSHTGEYACIGEFLDDRQTSQVFLNVEFGPEMIGPIKERHTIQFDDPVKLNCTAVGNPKPTITWIREDGSESSSTIEKFSANDYGNHVCEASNGVGVPALKSVFLDSKAKGSPKLITSTYYHEVKVGKNLPLICRCEQCGPIKFSSWSRDRSELSDVRGSLDAPTKNYNFDLSLMNVTSSDSGLYTCIIANEYNLVQKHMRVNVTNQPMIEAIVANGADSTTEDVIKVRYGKDVMVTCMVMGSPKPKVQWYKDEQLLPSDPSFMDNILRLGKVSENDIGTYKCSATNMLGSMSKEIKLNVIQPNFLMNTILITEEGQTVSLPCESRTWLFNDESLDVSKSRYTHIENTLVFRAKYEDSGIYQCLRLDVSAAAPVETVLMVQAPPIIFPNGDETIRVREGREAILKCNSQGNPLPEIKWIFKQKVLQSSHRYELLDGGDLRIRNVTQKVAGQFTCLATNKIGQAEKAVNVIVMVPPKITSEFYETKQVNPLDLSFPLTCSAIGRPEPLVSWYRDKKIHIAERKSENFLNIGPHLLSGNYTCVAKNLEGSESRSVIVKSKGPPILSENHHQTKHHLYEGSGLNLLCPFSDARDVFWYKDGAELTGARSGPMELLTIPVAERADAGSYSCVASNNYGESSFKHNVHIFPSEIPYPDEISYDEYTNIAGNDVTIRCTSAGGDISYRTKWIRNNRVISNETQLHLRNLTLNDTGIYECKDVNEIGYISTSAYLIVESPPEVQMAKENWVSVNEGDSLELECIITGIPVPEIAWQKDDEILNSSMTSTILSVSRVRASDAGLYKCLGSNKLGTEEITHHVDVLRAPELIVRNNNIMVAQTHKATFACEARGNPLPVIVLSYQGKKIFGTEHIPIVNQSSGTFFLNGNGEIIDTSEPTGDLSGKVMYNRDGIIFRVTLKGESHSSGRYTCNAISVLGTREAEINVIIADDIATSEDLKRSRHSVLVGLPLYLKCPWSKDEITALEWFKNGVLLTDNLSHDRGILSIPVSTLTTAGDYTCVANTVVGISTKEFLVEIRGTSYYDVDTTTKVVTLTCPAPKDISDNVIWDELIVEDHNITNTDIESTPDLTINDNHALTIYSCFHENSGSRTKKLEVQVHLASIVGYSESIRTVNIGDDVKMHCPIAGEGSRSYIDWLKDGRRIMRSPKMKFSRDMKMLNLRSVSEEDEGIYKCREVPGDIVRGIVLQTEKSMPEWSDWGSWTPCSKSCNTGTRTRERQCISRDGEPVRRTHCSGKETEVQICNDFPCPTNGNWSDWSDWTRCSVSCGLGSKMRTRQCNNPAPTYGGKVCFGGRTEYQSCLVREC